MYNSDDKEDYIRQDTVQLGGSAYAGVSQHYNKNELDLTPRSSEGTELASRIDMALANLPTEGVPDRVRDSAAALRGLKEQILRGEGADIGAIMQQVQQELAAVEQHVDKEKDDDAREFQQQMMGAVAGVAAGIGAGAVAVGALLGHSEQKAQDMMGLVQNAQGGKEAIKGFNPLAADEKNLVVLASADALGVVERAMGQATQGMGQVAKSEGMSLSTTA